MSDIALKPSEHGLKIPSWIQRSRRLLQVIVQLIGLSTLISACSRAPQSLLGDSAPILRVGVLHSRTGTMSFSENTVAEAELLAIEELNRRGGVVLKGERYRLEAVEEDGASQPMVFAQKAQQLIERDKVAVVFGGWTSSSRKAMIPVFEARNILLFYPVQYEGKECSPNVLYAGSAPNQQAMPAIEWLLQNKGQRFYLIGSDYIYPRSTNQQIRSILHGRGQIVGEKYLPLGSRDVAAVIADIKSQLPNGGIIINTLNGDSNVSFFQSLSAQGLDAAQGYTIMSFSISEEEVAAIGVNTMRGSYASWSFFQSLTNPGAKAFNTAFHNTYGAHRVTNDPSEAAYTMVMLWAAAVERADSTDTEQVRKALIGLRYQAPQGHVEVHPNLHLSKRSLIGEVQADGQFRVVHDDGVIIPQPWGSTASNHAIPRCDWRAGTPQR
jgi:urea transport system substrate-binding protein